MLPNALNAKHHKKKSQKPKKKSRATSDTEDDPVARAIASIKGKTSSSTITQKNVINSIRQSSSSKPSETTAHQARGEANKGFRSTPANRKNKEKEQESLKLLLKSIIVVPYGMEKHGDDWIPLENFDAHSLKDLDKLVGMGLARFSTATNPIELDETFSEKEFEAWFCEQLPLAVTRDPIPDDMLDLLGESVAEANISNSDLLGAKIRVEDERVRKDKTKGKEKVIEEALSAPFTQIPWHKSYSYSLLASIRSKSTIQDKNSDEEYQISDEEDKTSDEENQASDEEEGEVDKLPIAVRRAKQKPYIYVDTGSDQEESRSSDIKVLETTESQGSKVRSSTKRLHTNANNSASDEPLRKRSRSAEIVKTTTTEPSSSTAPPMDPTLSFLTSMPLAIMHKSSEDLYKK